MYKRSRYSASVRAYLRRLGNPYASLQLHDDPDEEIIHASDRTPHSYRQLEDPYAKLSMMDDVDESNRESSTLVAVPEPNVGRESLSRIEFRARCSRIFRQYIPVLEHGKLRTHYRDFIVRNESSSPSKRYRLVRHLEKYDLSTVQGVTARFNREREPLTDEKLRQIERLVDGED